MNPTTETASSGSDINTYIIFGALIAIYLIIQIFKWIYEKETARNKKLEQDNADLKSHYEALLKEERTRNTKYIEQRDKTEIENALRLLDLNGKAIAGLIKTETTEAFVNIKGLIEQLQGIISKNDRRNTSTKP